MFGNLRFITIFDHFLLPCQVDLSAHFFLPFLDQKCPQTKMLQRIDFPMEISVLKFQAWQFDEKTRFLRLLFFTIKTQSFTVLVVTCLDYH